MENSVRNIANKIAYACFVVVAIFILCSCSEQKKEEKDIPYFDDYVDFLLKYDVNTYDLSQYETYKNAPDVIEKLSESEKGLDSKTAFVKGIQSIMDGDNEEALNMFFKSLDLCKDEDEKIKLRDYCEIIQIYSAEGDIEKAKQYLKKFEDIYDTIPESEYCIDVVRWITNDVQNLPDDVDKVIDLIEKTRERAENLDLPASTQIVYRLARCYEINNENTRSMETLIEALRMAENDKDDYLAMFITVDLASAYLSRGNEEQAIEYLEGIEKYDLEDKGQEYEMKAYAKQNLAYVFYNKDDYEKAYQYAAESREYIEKEGDDLIKQDDILVNDVLMADILINQGKYEEGKELLDNAKDKYENSVKFSYVGFEHNINMTYGFYYRSIGDNDKALEYYLKIDNDFAGNEPGTYDYAYLCYIYEIYEDLGDYENAYKYLQKATDNMGAAYALAMDEQASYLLGEFQNEKKNQEIDYLKRKNSNATILLIFVAIVFILILVGIRIIYQKNKELGKINEKLKDLSEVDALTGLSNRRSLEDYLSTDWNKLVRNQFPVSVAMMDVDFFKLYNDNYGHQMGDVVLQSVGGYLEKHKRAHDFAARYGGEEFIVIMPNTDKELAAKLTETIRKSIFELGIEHKYSKVSDRVSLSIGVATLESKEYTKYDELIHKADTALYEAKKTRNCVYQYNVELEK